MCRIQHGGADKQRGNGKDVTRVDTQLGPSHGVSTFELQRHYRIL